ncbi:permease of the drug/metabolite transporter superfamily [Bacillus sp. OxB-1]|uniref:DMT family transporter n=1 Tax=Bacillus sp. (strain OxB-1) TaxID=98228 RepID=UPI0005820BA5|nr:DMT family transporter [Bacillus sp. OxB-1]BAQ11641.1 permease of the drug/metabolite transporter superfamily [Bacillus sp. OxB-1]
MSKGVLLIVLSMGLIGASIPIGESMMMTFPVWLFTCVTVTIAAVILIPIATISEKTKWTKLGFKNYYGMFMQALLTASLYTVFLLYGLTHADAISVGIISSITPAVVFILSLILLKEKLTLKKVLSILLAVAAVLLMNIVGVSADGSTSVIGITFMLLAVLSISLFFIYAKKFSVELPPITIAAGLTFFGALQTLPMALIELSSFDMSLFASVSNWGGIIIYSLLGWVLAYSTTFLAMPKIDASTAGMANAVMPIVASAVAILFYGASIRAVEIIALILVVISILIAESRDKKTIDEVEPQDYYKQPSV